MPPQNPFDVFAQNPAPYQPSMSPTNGQNLAHVAAIAFRLQQKMWVERMPSQSMQKFLNLGDRLTLLSH